MLELQYLRNHTEEAKKRLNKRPGYDTGVIDELIASDDERKRLQADLDAVLAEQNALAKEIGKLYGQGRKEEAEEKKTASAGLKEKSSELQRLHDETSKSIQSMLLLLPNLLQQGVPKGKSEADNEVVRTGGVAPQLPEQALPHWDLASKYNIIDFETGSWIRPWKKAILSSSRHCWSMKIQGMVPDSFQTRKDRCTM